MAMGGFLSSELDVFVLPITLSDLSKQNFGA